jgi:hypothetical protein
VNRLGLLFLFLLAVGLVDARGDCCCLFSGKCWVGGIGARRAGAMHKPA